MKFTVSLKHAFRKLNLKILSDRRLLNDLSSFRKLPGGEINFISLLQLVDFRVPARQI